MAKKLKKEEPRYKTQKEYEKTFKHSYYQMLINMNKSIIAKATKDVSDEPAKQS